MQQTMIKGEQNKRIQPEADLAKTAYELSSKGRNTILTTKLPGI